MKQPTKPVYFPGLNGLRFIAAAVVAICHVEQRKKDLGFANFFDRYFFYNAAGYSVTLFFVLSGFLITYLLLDEKEKHGRISLKKFYLRRVLRIWPLYFLVIFIACSLLPHLPFFNLPGENAFRNDFSFRFVMLLLILPNVLHVLNLDVPYSGQTWSIGVEEQFYLVWPIIFRRLKKYYLTLMLMIVAVVLLANGFLYISNNYFSAEQKMYSPLYKTLHFIGLYFTFFRISAMAIGGIGACLLFFNQSLKRFFVNRVAEIVAWLLLAVLIVAEAKIPYVCHEVYSCIFLVIILNAASGKSVFHFVLENRIVGYLGKISYGIYMFHGFMVVLSIELLYKSFGFTFNAWQTLILDILVIATTVALAAISYSYLERPFINLKSKMQRFKSARRSSTVTA